jgi:hypothetical protein
MNINEIETEFDSCFNSFYDGVEASIVNDKMLEGETEFDLRQCVYICEDSAWFRDKELLRKLYGTGRNSTRA